MLRYNNILYNDNANGSGGTRASFFCQGCYFMCEDCFNPNTHDFNGGKEFTDEVLKELMSVVKIYEKYYSGLNLIGGECFDNLEVCLIVAKAFKKHFPHKTIWIWSGYTFEEITKHESKLELLKLCDILVDGRFVKKLYNPKLKHKGSENQRIIDVQESLNQNKVVLSKYN